MAARKPHSPKRAVKDPQYKIALAVLVIIHAVGLFGLNSERLLPDFLSLIPINLLFTFSIVLSLHKKWNGQYLLFILSVFMIGMVVEFAGVKTGVLFGAYHYTHRLGPGIAGVPFAIGTNWVLLTYCTGMIGRRLSRVFWKRVLIGALLLVGLDVLIEPFAIEYELWIWDNGVPGLRNYVGWFATALVTLTIFNLSIRKTFNRMGVWAYFVLLGFFLASLLLFLLK